MAFRDNSTLIRTATKVNLVANNTSETYDGAGGAKAFVVADGDVGDDQLVNFGSDDSIITGKKIFDGNGDGYIAFGDNQTLDVDRTGSGDARKGNDNISVGGTGNDLVDIVRFLGSKDGGFAYADAGTRDALLGHFASGFQSTAGGGDSSTSAQALHIDNDVGDNTFNFGATSVALLTDNALGLNFGGDTINGLGADDLLIFTSKLYDSDGSGIVTFGKNAVLDLSGAAGPLPTDPSKGPGGQFDVNAPNQTQVYFLGEKVIDGSTYYYYGAAGASVDLGLATA